MEFPGRGFQPSQPANAGPRHSDSAPAGTNPASQTGKKSSDQKPNASKWQRYTFAGIGLLILLLFIAVIFFVAFSDKKSEDSFVDQTKLQAVFLQTGQVYFGDIAELNGQYIDLENIYYLQTSSTDATKADTDTNVSLVKLGCELHAPDDRMLINRDQVTFWENLHADGQVAKAVATFQKDNPDGQKCSDQSAAPNSSTNVQGTSTNTNTSGTTTTKQ